MRASVTVRAVGIAGLRGPKELGRICNAGDVKESVSLQFIKVLYKSNGDP